jgi:protease I
MLEGRRIAILVEEDSGIVKGRRGTRPSLAVDLKNAGAIRVDEPAVRDGNIITSRRPADLPKLNRAVISA